LVAKLQSKAEDAGEGTIGRTRKKPARLARAGIPEAWVVIVRGGTHSLTRYRTDGPLARLANVQELPRVKVNLTSHPFGSGPARLEEILGKSISAATSRPNSV
jgi:hypothetical protein